jgi:predicted permease
MTWVDACVRDVSDSLRVIRKRPLLSAAIVVTLALGVGADVGVFALINGALFKPRVTHEPDRFVEVASRSSSFGGVSRLTSLQDYRAYRDGAHSFVALAAWTTVHATLTSAAAGFRAVPLLVTCNFFAVYGIEQPIAGRLFRSDECDEARPLPVVVIGEDLWRVQLGAAPNIVGSSITLDRRSFTVVGIMPSGYSGHLRTDIWIPYPMARVFFGGRDLVHEPSAAWLMTLAGRLRPGVSRDSARTELNAIAVAQDRLVAGRSTTLRLTNGSFIDSDVIQPMTFWIVPLVMGALTLVVLLVCANVTTLLLSRAAARRQEMAIRISLGATRTRLVAMLLTESVTLAVLAAPLAAALSAILPWAFRRQVPTMPVYPFGADAKVWAYLCGTTLVAGFAAGIAPALESLKRDVAASLHGYDAPIGRSGRWHVRELLIVTQVALSLVLLVGAGLFVAAEVRLTNADAGYDAARVLLVAPRIRVPPYALDTAASFYRRLTDRVRAIPGVRAVAFAGAPPFGGDIESGGRPAFSVTTSRGTRLAVAAVNAITPDYFAVLGIPIVRGSTVATYGDGGRVKPAVVSASLGRAVAKDRDPIGELMHDDAGRGWQIVGIARDVDTPASKARADLTLYVPRAADAYGDAMVTRFDGDPRPVADGIRRAIAELDPDAMAEPQTLAALRDDVADRVFSLVRMLLLLAATALALALIGIYGVVAFGVRLRSREFGIHVALGATRAQIVGLVLSSGLKPIVSGAVVGVTLSLVASLALTRIFHDAPFPLDPQEPTVYGSVAILLCGAAISAMIGPACRAAWSDPARVLRQD